MAAAGMPGLMTREENLQNPLGLVHSKDKWVGMSEDQPDPKFVKFLPPQGNLHFGLRAGARNFRSYQREGITTLSVLAAKMAPASDGNDPIEYAQFLADQCQWHPDMPVVFDNIMPQLVKAVVIRENGRCIYPDAMIAASVASGAPAQAVQAAAAPAAPAAPSPPAITPTAPQVPSMTMADLLYKIWGSLASHRTKIVGILIVMNGWLAEHPELIPPKYQQAAQVLSGILTILCGVGNTSAIAQKLKGKSS